MASLERHRDERTFFDLAAELDARGAGAMLLAINLNQRQQGDVGDTGFHTDCAVGPHRLLRYDARSVCRGLVFDEWLDDMNFAGLITQYRMELIR